MKKLSRSQLKQRSDLLIRLEKLYEAAEHQITAYNEGECSHGMVESAVERYNEAVGDANCLLADVRSDIEDYIEGRSEKWQEGERGDRYREWLDLTDDLDTIETPEAETDEDGNRTVEDLDGYNEAYERLNDLWESVDG